MVVSAHREMEKKRIAGCNISVCGDNKSSLCTDGTQLHQMLKTDDDFMKLLSNKKWTDSFNYPWIGSIISSVICFFFASLMWQFAAFTVHVFVAWICFSRVRLQIWFEEFWTSHFELEEVIYRLIDNFGLCDGRRCLQPPPLCNDTWFWCLQKVSHASVCKRSSAAVWGFVALCWWQTQPSSLQMSV